MPPSRHRQSRVQAASSLDPSPLLIIRHNITHLTSLQRDWTASSAWLRPQPLIKILPVDTYGIIIITMVMLYGCHAAFGRDGTF